MMKQRCLNPKATAFRYYGGRGIGVCELWLKFDNFIADVGPAPTERHSLDRFPDPDGNYEPGNVRWATTAQLLSELVNGVPAARSSRQQTSQKSDNSYR